MVKRRRKKKNKLRGKRSHGKGNTKNKRGAGTRGGRGRAGSHKHKFSKYWHTFGIKKRLKPKAKGKALNLESLSKSIGGMIERKVAEKKQEKIVLDCRKAGIEKILGKGNINFALIALNCNASKKAIEKIEKAGGKIEGKEIKSERAESEK